MYCDKNTTTNPIKINGKKALLYINSFFVITIYAPPIITAIRNVIIAEYGSINNAIHIRAKASAPPNTLKQLIA